MRHEEPVTEGPPAEHRETGVPADARTEMAEAGRWDRWLDGRTLVLVGLFLLGAGLLGARHGPALADEYVYLAGGRHFAATGRLDARFYDARAILERGWPHQDVHSPGYTILLGAAMAVFRGGYWTAVALNAAAYVLLGLLVRTLARILGAAPRAAWGAGVSTLVLPAFLPYVFWVMPEVLLGTLFVGALVLSRRGEGGLLTAAGAGLLLGAGVLLRETVIFGLPALLVLQRRRVRALVITSTVAALLAFVYVPLSRHRAPGGINTWQAPLARPPQRFGFEMVVRAQSGQAWRGAVQSLRRARWNVGYVARMGTVERAILGLFAALFVFALLPRRAGDRAAARCARALVLGAAALVATLLGAFVIGYWSGFRYLMFLAPAFTAWIAVPPAHVGRRLPSGLRMTACLAAAGAALVAATFAVLNDYKTSRQARQAAVTAEAERYVRRRVTRVALPNGWEFGLRHYPAEVISSLPPDGGTLRALERTIWFDYLFLPAGSPLVPEWDGRARYLRLDRHDPQGAFTVYRRLR